MTEPALTAGSASATKNARDDALALAAIGILVTCTVTFDHEALGHGTACLAAGGRITLLTSSLFHCEPGSRWISPAGPLANFTLGLFALTVRDRCARWPLLQLFLLFMTAAAWFWEGGYLVKAMLARGGDLYFAGTDFIGAPEWPWRAAGVILGTLLYLGTIRVTSRALRQYFGDSRRARRGSRWVWVGATLGAVLAALCYAGAGLQDLHDAFLEIGAATLPLLWIPRSSSTASTSGAAPVLRNNRLLLLAGIVFLIFVLTLGRGLGDFPGAQ